MYLRNRLDNALLLPHQWVADRVAYFCDRTCFWLAWLMSHLYLILTVALEVYWGLSWRFSSIFVLASIGMLINLLTAFRNIREAKASQLRFDAGQPVLHKDSVIERPREYLFLFCVGIWFSYLVEWVIWGPITLQAVMVVLWLLALLSSEYFLVCYPNIPRRKHQFVSAFSGARG